MQSKSKYAQKHDEFASFLNSATTKEGNLIDWSWWCTFTTGYELSMNSARHSMNRLYETMHKESPTVMMWCAEPFDVKEGFHTHAMVSTNLSFDRLGSMWQVSSAGVKYGKHNRLKLVKYDSEKGAGWYISKYISKKLSDWDMYHQLDNAILIESERDMYHQIDRIPHKRIEVNNIERHINEAEFSAPIYQINGY